jgi:hypothetical protein
LQSRNVDYIHVISRINNMNKEYILREIDRTAKENSGKPLGVSKFSTITGIKKSDWYGKYWSKWSDALIEAGRKPNIMQRAYDENELIQRVISFIRELGKVPTAGDLRLKAHITQDFPALNTISRRLGSNQSELATKIIDYCKGKSEYLDVYEICKKVPAVKAHKAVNDLIKSTSAFGYVYLMKSGRFYKIGNSNNVERRNYELGIKLPEEIKIAHKIQTDDPNGVEGYWHNRFSNKRKQGEWFELSPSDIAAFRRRKFM